MYRVTESLISTILEILTREDHFLCVKLEKGVAVDLYIHSKLKAHCMLKVRS
jgi:hypothetical protein